MKLEADILSKNGSVQSRLLRSGFKYLTFPIIMGSAVVVYFYEQANSPAFVLLISFGLMVIVSLLLYLIEKVIPYRADWSMNDGQDYNDFGHAVFGTLLGAKLGREGVALIFPLIAVAISNFLGFKLWPAHFPVIAQVVIVFLIADFGRYWEHRLMHRVPALWRFHALHHSAEKLTILKTYRNHFIERCFQSVMSFGPLVLLGVPANLLLVYSVPNIFLGLFSHSNADLRFGYLEYLINGPGAHRYHHSIDEKEGNTNYGSAIVTWDILFGTYTCPVGKPGPTQLGIQDDTMPKQWVSQFLSPFIWSRIANSSKNEVRANVFTE